VYCESIGIALAVRALCLSISLAGTARVLCVSVLQDCSVALCLDRSVVLGVVGTWQELLARGHTFLGPYF
jgi:hypothetical protein